MRETLPDAARSWLRLPWNELHVQRHRDDEVRTRLERTDGLVRRLITRHDPDVADVVPIMAARRIRTVERRSEQPRLIELPDELHIVVIVGDTVFLETPCRIHAPDLEIVVCVRLAVAAIEVRDGVELLELFREHRTADARH